MKRALAMTLALASLPWAVYGVSNQTAGAGQSAEPKHELYTPNKLVWTQGPPSLPAGVKAVVLEGDPAKEGYFALRLLMPDGYTIPPHWHPQQERVTVISGTLHLGMGEKYDRDAAPALPAGSYASMEPGMRHFAWAEGPTIIQLATIGPWGITYVNPADDPRQQKR